MRVRKRLNDLLLEYNFISQENLQKALEKQKEQGGQLGIIVVEQGFVKEEDIVICFSQYLHIPTIRILKYTVKPEITKIIPERVARHYSVLSLSRLGNVLSVVMSDPSNLLAIDDLKALTGYDISIVVDGAGNINKAIDRFYHIHNQKTEQNADGTDSLSNVLDGIDQHDLEVVKDQEQVDISEVIRSSEEAPIVKMIDALIAEALLKRASDVHIEPYEYKIRVRYRIDGALISAATLPKKIQNAVSARVKIMSGMDITQRHIPQDGRFKVKFQNKEVDFRVSVLPVIFGEKVVLRVLDRANLSVGLQKLGFLPQSMNAISYAVTVPYGMILITGPTGSGKSTTLYSILNQLNTPDKNIITVEEPVEYQIPGITQVQVKPDIGLTFAAGLRSFLRQNPDILMVGEIRDFETADIAVKAALTGALLLSTLHTNDAPGAITRLIDMGVEPFLIASSVIAVAAQRLAKKLCPHCKEPYNIPQPVLDRLGLKIDADKFTAYRAKGCVKCGQRGYLGRFAILEIMLLSSEIKTMIIRRIAAGKIKEFAKKEQGMLTLRQAGLAHFVKGATSLEEILRITSSE